MVVVTPAVGVSCVAEAQYDMRRSFNLVTQLRIDGSLAAGCARIEAATIHVFNAAPHPLAADWQVFSNIEEKSMAAGIAVAGCRLQTGGMSFFIGIRNLNEDYFTSPVTAFFTNSSCGIFPVLSADRPIANYPMSALCADYRVKGEKWEFESSLYNGVARPGNRLDRIFRFSPRKEGLFGISSVNYNARGGHYFGGFFLHHRPSANTASGGWVYAEQTIFTRKERRVEMLLQYATRFSGPTDCRRYGAGGFLLSGFLLPSRNDRFGIVMNGARYGAGLEKALELTWRADLGPYFAIQPAFHFITNPDGKFTVATCRISVSF